MNIPRKISIENLFKQHMMEFVLIVIVVALSLFASGFFTVNNLLGIFRSVAITGVISFGMTMAIIGGEIDLSVGSSIALSAVLTALISGNLASSGMNPDVAVAIAIIIALCVGALIGLFNGFIRTRFNIPSFIITLAMLNVLYGIAAVLSGGFPILIQSSWYSFIGTGQIFNYGGFRGIPVPGIWLILVFVIVAIIMNKTRFGREVYAVGGNMESARLSGINVKKVKILVMMMPQLLGAFAGIILSSQVMAGSPQFGRGHEIDVISAVIIGGASLNGGIGRVWGTLIGIIFLGVLLNGMTLLGVDTFVTHIVRGSLILIAVLVNTVQTNRKRT